MTPPTDEARAIFRFWMFWNVVILGVWLIEAVLR